MGLRGLALSAGALFCCFFHAPVRLSLLALCASFFLPVGPGPRAGVVAAAPASVQVAGRVHTELVLVVSHYPAALALAEVELDVFNWGLSDRLEACVLGISRSAPACQTNSSASSSSEGLPPGGSQTLKNNLQLTSHPRPQAPTIRF